MGLQVEIEHLVNQNLELENEMRNVQYDYNLDEEVKREMILSIGTQIKNNEDRVVFLMCKKWDS